MSTGKISGFVLELKTFNDFMNNPDESVWSETLKQLDQVPLTWNAEGVDISGNRA